MVEQKDRKGRKKEGKDKRKVEMEGGKSRRIGNKEGKEEGRGVYKALRQKERK